MKHLTGLLCILVCSVALAAPPEIKAPEIVKGEAGDFIPVLVETEGKQVKYVPLTPGLKVFPSGFLANPKSTVVSAKEEGDYKLLCYTAKGDEVTDPVYIIIRIGAGGVLPDDMTSKDPLYKPILAAYKALPDGEKAKKAALAAVYKATADSVNGIDTAGALFNVIKQASDARVGAGVMKSVRELFGGELETVLPNKVNQVLTQTEKDAAVKQLKRFATILEQVK